MIQGYQNYAVHQNQIQVKNILTHQISNPNANYSLQEINQIQPQFVQNLILRDQELTREIENLTKICNEAISDLSKQTINYCALEQKYNRLLNINSQQINLRERNKSVQEKSTKFGDTWKQMETNKQINNSLLFSQRMEKEQQSIFNIYLKSIFDQNKQTENQNECIKCIELYDKLGAEQKVILKLRKELYDSQKEIYEIRQQAKEEASTNNSSVIPSVIYKIPTIHNQKLLSYQYSPPTQVEEYVNQINQSLMRKSSEYINIKPFNADDQIKQSYLKPYNQPIQKQSDQPIQKSYNQSIQQSSDQPIQKSYNQPIQKSSDQPIQKSSDQPNQIKIQTNIQISSIIDRRLNSSPSVPFVQKKLQQSQCFDLRNSSIVDKTYITSDILNRSNQKNFSFYQKDNTQRDKIQDIKDALSGLPQKETIETIENKEHKLKLFLKSRKDLPRDSSPQKLITSLNPKKSSMHFKTQEKIKSPKQQYSAKQ